MKTYLVRGYKVVELEVVLCAVDEDTLEDIIFKNNVDWVALNEGELFDVTYDEVPNESYCDND